MPLPGQAVCEGEEGHTFPMSAEIRQEFTAGSTPSCSRCGALMRPRIMLYEDEHGDLMCDDYEKMMQDDLKKARGIPSRHEQQDERQKSERESPLHADAHTRQVDLILWLGISFAQAASTEYFRTVRRMLRENKCVRSRHDGAKPGLARGQIEMGKIFQSCACPFAGRRSSPLWSVQMQTGKQAGDRVPGGTMTPRVARAPRQRVVRTSPAL